MVKAHLYIEGGGDSKELRSRCREGFTKLLKKCGFTDRMPRVTACGPRNDTFDDFKIAHKQAHPGNFIAMWIDSEDPLQDINAAWGHLKARIGDGWQRPDSAIDDQVLFMTTCMETLIAADRPTLKQHYGHELAETALLPLLDLENRDRKAILDSLTHATRKTSKPYSKGQRSFELLAKLNPDTLSQHLPSFHRTRSILEKRL